MSGLKRIFQAGTLFALVAVAAQVHAQPQPIPQPGQPAPATGTAPASLSASSARLEPDTDLIVLLRSVEARTGRHFILHPLAPERVALGGAEVEEIDYERLLIILDNYDLVAIEVEDTVNFVPAQNVRHRSMRVLTATSQENVPADEVVTMVINVSNIEAPSLVPILRPMLPQWGHMAAMPQSNAVIVVDRYANVQRLLAVITELDR